MNKKKQGETSHKETSFGIIPRSKLIPLEIEGIKKAWDFVVEKRSKGKIRITSGSMREIHAKGFKWIFPEMGGKFRAGEVQVSKHIPPQFFMVPQLMDDFCKDLEARIKNLQNLDDANFLQSLIALLSWFHHRFLWIHPFADYNGRVARLLSNIILLKHDIQEV